MKKQISLLTVLIVGLIATCGLASALPVSIDFVKIDGDEIKDSGTNFVKGLEKNQDLSVKVQVKASEDVEDVQIEAVLRGYDHDDLMEDITDVFDMKANVSYTKKLDIPLRIRMDQDRYKLRIRIDNRDGETESQTYELEVDTKRHLLMIKDIILSPENEVKAGRALLVAVRVQNYGERDEDGIRVKASIPELGVSATDYIDELEKEGDDDQTTSEELYLRIPEDADTGTYVLRVEATYDDGDETEVEELLVFVKSECDADPFSCEERETQKQKTVISIAADVQTATQAGGEVVYPITIANEGTESKTYIISADGADWANFRVSPSNVVVVGAGETKAVNVYVSAGENAPVGEQSFVVSVNSDDKTLKEIPMKVNVAQGESSAWEKVKNALQIGIVVLVILLVILGLIIGFNKLKGDDEDKEKEGETYY